MADGIGVGGDSSYLNARNACNANMSLLELSTTIDTFLQALPPLPYELVVSNTRSSQSRMLVGADIDTTGKAEKSGLCITSVLGTIAVAQLCVAVQLLNKESQNALMEAPCAIASVSPGFAQTKLPELNR